MNNLTLIIPAKNEKESLPHVLKEIIKKKVKIHIILEKTDKKTIKSILKFKCKIIFQKNKGYGDALIHGINSVKSKYFCIFNADGSFDPRELDMMLKKISRYNYDFIFGSRYEKNSGSDDDTIVTKIGNFFFTLVGNVFFKLNITDILYTYVLGRTNKAKKLKLKQKDFTFCAELPLKASQKKMKLSTINCYERCRIGGKKKVSAFKDGYLILVYMIKFFFNKS
jgi:glycosyltransferase involved in cell wall biosynthesis